MSWAEDGIGTNVYSLCRETNLYTQLEGQNILVNSYIVMR